MKFFIAFMLFFFTNCLAPAAISATVNSTAASCFIISHTEKLNFGKESTFKCSKRKLKKLKNIGSYIEFSIILIVFGILLLIVAKKKISSAPAAANSSYNIYNLPDFPDGTIERFLGCLSIFLGILTLIIKKDKSIRRIKTEPTSK
jgi:hypothetical protein